MQLRFTLQPFCAYWIFCTALFQMNIVSDLICGSDDDDAICAPDRESLSYGLLREQIQRTGRALRGAGIDADDRVAIVLDNGPTMAAAFVCMAPWCVTAPLNPAYKADELDFYLSDLDAMALLVASGSKHIALDIARKNGMRILEIEDEGPSGGFTLLDVAETEVAERSPDALALILHTSGTTSRPKMVPLTQENLFTSAMNIAATLMLTTDDACLNVMPLFHIHGLMAPVLASFASGSSVYCSSGFDALRFFGWLKDADPSWYSAVPTMHQAILARAPRNRDVITSASLRFIRSSSASLPPSVMKELEKTFDAPVIEAYAMTEASHQMCSNPLPPETRKAGFVGPAAGPEVAVMNGDGMRQPTLKEGEIVIRGRNVTTGYLSNTEANANAFFGDWFRTGDQGFIDEDGYVKVTGRLKEIINRGGEKIAPLEVDEVMIGHPAVAQVCTFAIPHERLGEEIGAAVVLVEGKFVEAGTLREFASMQLADFKVPRRIVFVDEIPKGATGKIQRITLASELGLGS